MNGYLAHFIVYTMAMTGFIAFALYVYKKTMISGNVTGNTNFLKIENAMRLTPGKMLYVVKAGTERFLIAGDAQNTTMLAKLAEDNIVPEENTISSEKTNILSLKTLQKLYRG